VEIICKASSNDYRVLVPASSCAGVGCGVLLPRPNQLENAGPWGRFCSLDRHPELLFCAGASLVSVRDWRLGRLRRPNRSARCP
jgi:hypothetical protein